MPDPYMPFLGDAAEDSGPGQCSKSSAETASGLSANVPIAPPHEAWHLWLPVFIWNWHDWEISGICTRDGKRYVFCAIDDGLEDEECDNDYRVFGIYDPPAEKWAEIEEAKKDFERMVGTHWSFDLTEDQKKSIQKVDGDYWKKWPSGNGRNEMSPEWMVAIGDSRICVRAEADAPERSEEQETKIGPEGETPKP